MAVLEEAGVAFTLRRVDSEGGECDTPGYREVQPLGLMPALRLGDGRTIFESAAIVQYLGDSHGLGTLAPALDEADRPGYLQWLHFMAGTVYPTYNRYYWPPEYMLMPPASPGCESTWARSCCGNGRLSRMRWREMDPGCWDNGFPAAISICR